MRWILRFCNNFFIIKDEIKTIKHGDDFADSLYRDWYSFAYNGDVYYITKLNFTKSN